MQHPNDYVAWAVRHQRLDLTIFGVTRRAIALTKAVGLAGAHGFGAEGWTMGGTCKIPTGRTDATAEARRSLQERAGTGYPVFYNNDHSLHRQVFGHLLMFEMSKDDTAKVMQGVRADLKQFLAQVAHVD